jgi:hypothetical protein
MEILASRNIQNRNRLTFTFLFICSLFFGAKAQCFSCDSITNYEVHEVYNNLLLNSYPLADATCFGSKMAKHDKKNGLKRVLLFYGPFTDGCLECYYYKHGFESYNIGAADIVSKASDVFVNAYNRSMESLLEVHKKNIIPKYRNPDQPIFDFWLPSKSDVAIEYLDDSTLSFKIHSDTLENLFQEDIEHLVICVGDSITDPNFRSYDYLMVKTLGVEIAIEDRSSFELHVFYDFQNVPDKHEICWCKALEQKYRFSIPVELE